MAKDKKHQKRMGVGCRHEDYEEYYPTLCGWAQWKFGGYHKCGAPKTCWMDTRVTTSFRPGRHCPNCSMPNNPVKLTTASRTYHTCHKCGFKQYLTK